MRLWLVEAATFARRLSRRRIVMVALALDAAALGWAVFVSPVASLHAAFAAAQGLGALTTLVASAGCLADDRAAGRLVMAATHPVPRSAFVLGRWIAVAAAGIGVATLASVAAALAGPGLGASPARFAAGLAALAAHVGAVAALAVALSCGAGSTAQVLTLLGLLVIGVMPPEVLPGMLGGAWAAPASHAAWAVLPTPWALDRIQAWALGVEAGQPLLVLALVAQPPVWLAAGSRALSRAELGARSG